jgi:hypothetical protein
LTGPQLLAVLRVQDLDTALDQHRHRRATLPEREALIKLDSSRQALARTRAEVSARRDEVAGSTAPRPESPTSTAGSMAEW